MFHGNIVVHCSIEARLMSNITFIMTTPLKFIVALGEGKHGCKHVEPMSSP